MSSGRIIQIIGAVIDVEFERNSVPKIYDALQVDGTETTLEVQQQLGDGVFVPSQWVLLKVLNVV
jgi:F-type H+-transporting ATPase subunit beta